MKGAEDSDLATYFGDLSQSENLSKINPPLRLCALLTKSSAISRLCTKDAGSKLAFLSLGDNLRGLHTNAAVALAECDRGKNLILLLLFLVASYNYSLKLVIQNGLRVLEIC